MIDQVLAWFPDRETALLLGGVLALLVLASVVNGALVLRTGGPVGDLGPRIRAWWGMVAVFATATAIGPTATVVLFAIMSFLALREFITLTPTRRGDHRTLFWVFFVILPLHYLILGSGWYGMFVIFIPVYAFLFVPIRSALGRETTDFLGRVAKIQWAMMICIYSLSHVPALLHLNLDVKPAPQAALLLWFVIVVQVSDVFQYCWGKLLGRHQVSPTISPKKTWEGFVLGIASASGLGAGLWWATPFTPLEAGLVALVICAMGFAGDITMSAIKRDRGIKDFGALLPGHGGMMDRIDSLVFAAPVFYHIVRHLGIEGVLLF